MKRSEKFANPFYGLLLVAGIAFAITATAYGVMAFRDRDTAASVASASAEEHPLMTWMNEHGAAALGTELAILAVGTIGAIATDDYWQRRNRTKNV
ncbi:MAG: hypothetical protein L0228_21850 [Planctomycetes bacterium]|nr:hypothetical protein [Planctomycetota bacterium]